VVRDLLTDATYTWRGEWNFVELDPSKLPAHVLRIERQEPVSTSEVFKFSSSTDASSASRWAPSSSSSGGDA
jgi:hypothetical protein